MDQALPAPAATPNSPPSMCPVSFSVSAGPAFDFTFSLLMLAMIIIGGVGTSIGPLLGAVVVYIPSYFLLTSVAQAQPLIIGLLVIIMALFLPDGIVGLLRRSNERLRLVLE